MVAQVTSEATPGDGDGAEIDPAAIEEELEDTKRRVAQVPAVQVVANHAMGLFELGAIHLSAQPPNLVDAALSIDALACLVEGLGDRLGENAQVLRDALQQIRLAFVQVKGTLTPE